MKLALRGRADPKHLQGRRAALAIDTAPDLELRWVSLAVPDAAQSRIGVFRLAGEIERPFRPTDETEGSDRICCC